MPERDALSVYVSEGFSVQAAGIRREKNGDLTADLMLHNGKVAFVDRAALNSPEGRLGWAERAVQPGSPTAPELATAILEQLYPAAVAQLQEQPTKPTQADQLIELLTDLAADVAGEAELFHDPDGVAYATITVDDHRETWPLRSRAFRTWLSRRYFEQHQKAPNTQALIDATNVLEGKALFEGREYPTFVRLAEAENIVYFDLGDSRWTAVAVDAAGWRIVLDPPVKFRRPKGMLPLPMPVEGGKLAELRRFVNVASDNDWRLLIAWLIGALRPRGPCAVLVVHGEQGSGKSTLGRLLRSLFDPNVAAIRSIPRTDRDLYIAAMNGRVLIYDNLSDLPRWLSDALCQIATGSGFATRTLYENAEETLLSVQRPILLNGIEELATRGDLLDRALIIYLPAIPDETRLPEDEYWAAFDAARPKLLGALLDAVSMALRNLPTTKLVGHPRMADFAKWMVAAEPALGWEAGAFLAAYRANRGAANDLSLDASPVATTLQTAMTNRGDWQGTATELLKLLNDRADEATRRLRGWPGTARTLSNILRRLAPNLRAAGLALDFDQHKHGGKRLITITKPEQPCTSSSPASPDGDPPEDDGKSSGEPNGEDGGASAAVGDAVDQLASPPYFAQLREDLARGDAGDDEMQPPSQNGVATELPTDWETWEESL